MSRSLMLAQNRTRENLLSADRYDDVRFAARWRLIRVFADAGGYLSNLDEEVGVLANWLRQSMPERVQAKVFAVSDLPSHYRHHTARARQSAVRRARYELYVGLLEEMHATTKLWYIDGQWYMPPSTLEEYWTLFPERKQTFFNQRRVHGRPRSQTARLKGLRLAQGMSTSAA